MRILVLSDSHGSFHNLRDVLKMHTSAEVVIFLGDGEDDFRYAKSETENRHVIMVKGNCDYYSSLDENITQTIEGKRFFITHGYVENVKFGEDRLIYKGQSLGADIILYGHTHIPVNHVVDSIQIFNPGSLRDGNYGFIDITPKGTICVNAKLY